MVARLLAGFLLEVGMAERTLTDADVQAIAVAFAKIQPFHPSNCNFPPETVSALADFAERIKDPAVREAMVNVSTWYLDGASITRKWTIRMFMIGVAAAVLFGFYTASKPGGAAGP
jgi:hypothetical protein